MSGEQKTIRRYSLSFKRMVVSELEAGSSLSSVRERYGIGGGGTLQNWIRRFGKDYLLTHVVRIETMNERDRIKELERQLKETKVALADTVLEKKFLEILIDEANKEYKTDLKKNFGTDLPNRLPRPDSD